MEVVMYAAMTKFAVPPGMRPKMEQLADQMKLGMSQMKGFVSVTFFVNEAINVYGSFAMWETREDGMAAREITDPKLNEALEGILIGEIGRELFEVYEPSN